MFLTAVEPTSDSTAYRIYAFGELWWARQTAPQQRKKVEDGFSRWWCQTTRIVRCRLRAGAVAPSGALRPQHLIQRPPGARTRCAFGDVLDRRAESEMHFATEGVECPQIARAIGDH